MSTVYQDAGISFNKWVYRLKERYASTLQRRLLLAFDISADRERHIVGGRRTAQVFGLQT